MTSSPPRLLRWLLRVPVRLYRWRCGWVLGHRFLLLRHTGRTTGLARETVLEVLRYDTVRDEAVVMSGFGVSADWLRNIRAGGAASVVIGRHTFDVSPRVLAVDDAVEVFADYEHRNRFVGPIVRAVLSRLLGWKYHGTDDERHRVVQQLPLVAFDLAPVDR